MMAKNPHAAALGKLGGSVSSPAKTAAVRANAKRPRPNARGKLKPRRGAPGDKPSQAVPPSKPEESASVGAKDKQPRRKRMTYRDKIQHEYRDSDGYWIELKPGWQNGADPGTHGIVEGTKREAHRTLRSVESCNCLECQQLMARSVPAPEPL